MDHDALILLAQSSVRRLFALRNGPHKVDARHAIRQWLRTLKANR